MAYDKIVDSAQLDSDLTSVANAIRAKGGTSAALAFPSGFVSAIGDIASGGDPDLAVFDYTNFPHVQSPTNYNFTNGCTQKKIKVLLGDGYSGTSPVFTNASKQLEEVVIQTNGIINNIQTIVYNSYVKHLTLNFSTANIPASGWGSYAFRSAGGGTDNSCRIDGLPIDLSGIASDTSTLCSSGMFYQAKINYVRFKPNTLNMSGTARLEHGLTGKTTLADEESLISTVNVLGEITTGTFSWLSNATVRRNQMESIIGRDDTSNGYHLFVKDASGPLSLIEFVTNVKGWTLA